ncbi:MAG: hypothetical protein D6816_09240 [Bacteroidetes bacterium]|nr:MAG: hypothetical protein D6816_09240 [Bacteroidota bacterium]
MKGITNRQQVDNQNQTQGLNVSHASTAGNSSPQDAGDGVNTAPKHVDRQPTGNGENCERYGDMVTQHVTQNGSKPGQRYIPEGFTRNCDHCGREYLAKRETSRFCGAVCRVAFWRAKQRGQS